MEIKDLVSIGRITRSIGLAGELEIKTNDDFFGEPLAGEALFIEINRSKIPYFISEIKQTGDRYRVKLDDIDTQDQARQFSNLDVFAPQKEKAPSKQNELSSIIGYKAVDGTLGELGEITDIHEYPGQQVLAIKYNKKEVLLPVTPDFISRIDDKKRIVHVQCPDGLLDVYK